MLKTQKVALREMTDDMFDVLDNSRKGYLEIEDMVRFFYRRSVPPAWEVEGDDMQS
jgi:hypothetical protein